MRTAAAGMIAAILTTALAAALPAAAAGFDWPAPAGWRTETIPFPLGFAPELKHRGTEELRFSPGFFDPKSETYWTYAFAWWLEDKPDTAPEALERELARYFAGLCGAVGGKKYRFDADRFRVKLSGVRSGRPLAHQQHAVAAYTGTIESYDAFVTGKPITLNVEVRGWSCDQAGRNVMLVMASPQPREGAVWKDLHEREAAFQCHP